MRLTVLAGMSLLLAAGQVQAKEEVMVREGLPAWAAVSEPLPVPADAAGAVFFRRQDTEVYLGPDGPQVFNAYRVKLLHTAALQLGNLSMVWNPASGTPIVHAIRIYRGDQVIDVLKSSSFEILRREDQLEMARLDGNLTAILRVPDLRVGDELEFAATVPDADPVLGRQDAGILLLGEEPPPGRFRLMLKWAGQPQPSIKLTKDLEPLARRGADSIEFAFDNPPLLTPPKDAPPRHQLQRLVQYSNFADWQAVSRRFAGLFVDAARLETGSPIKQEAARIAAASTSPLDRAAAALRLVQQDTRYIFVGLNGGNFQPASADETWRRRYGDCKAKTALLLALLGELGIKAEPVLVNNSGNDDGMDERLPSARNFDHVLVRASIGGKTYWMDGTLPAVATMSPEPAVDYRWVLPVTAAGAALEKREWKPAASPDEISLFEIDAREGFDQPAKITSTTIRRGIPGLVEDIQFSALTPSQLLNAFRQNAIGDTFQTIEDVTWRYDERARASVLTVVGTGLVDWDKDGGASRSMPLPGGGFNPPDRRIRPAEQDQSLPFFSKPSFDCHVTTVRLPSSTKPANWSHKNDIDSILFGKAYYRAFDLRDGSLRMIRGMRVEQVEITAATAQRDNGRLPRFDNSMGYVFYDPADTNTDLAAKIPVPATYEIDWTADNVPCLATMAGK